jgi:hypothetical protein
VKKIVWLLALGLGCCSSIYGQNRYDVVIDEIMADPVPLIGLPNSEWIELKNTGSAPVNLQNWRIGDATSISGAFPNYTLRPDSFVIVCSSGSLAALSALGSAIAVTSFPSLDNDGDQLFLRASNGKTIHAVSYSINWHKNETKKEGGWTLEMIDTGNPCSGFSNWTSSISATGGTPGKKNSVDGNNIDNEPPKLIKAYTLDSLTIILSFDEPVDSLPATTISNYTIDRGLPIAGVSVIPPLFNEVRIKLSPRMQPNTVYTITANNVKDCKGNRIVTANTARTGLPVEPEPGEWIINEILFNPRSGAYDYVEFYNNSNKIFDASRLYIGNKSSGGVVSSIRQLSATPFYIFPGEYIVETEDSISLSREFNVKDPSKVLQVSSPPSFPDDEGTVVSLKFQGIVLEELHYDHSWHFKLLRDEEGVALERMDPDGKTQDPGNWHSASTNSGYGTPTSQNSQYKRSAETSAAIEIVPIIFSPDNDGMDDIAGILYKMEEPGWVANIHIFDTEGRPVRYLVKNAVLGLKGNWTWDGLDEKGNKLPIGNYIIATELFNLKGKRKAFKSLIVLARRLN